MADDVDLKALEKKAYRSFFNDGLWDLFIGLIILNFGLNTFLSSLLNLSEFLSLIILTLGWNILAFLIFFLGKKFITIPRIGFVKFGPKRKSKEKKLKIFLSAFVIVNIFMVILPFTALFGNIELKPLLLTLFLGLTFFTFPFCVVAYFLDFNRLYYYAILAGIGLFLTELLYPILGSPLDTILSFGITGGAIVVIGLYYFIRFLKKYPLS
ncbi:MAG: hypothetical protein ACFFBF_10300 [Promethearchaeota archaeon]